MIGKKIVVHKNKCPQDHPCPLVNVCPAGAISQHNFKAPEVDQAKCINCGLCVQNCAYGAFGFIS
jgi:Fe-S-cluster-containing hydrogenase component 2